MAVLDSPLAELQGDDVVSLFEAIGRNNMELVFTVLLTPSGAVESSSLEGDPLDNLPTDTDVTEMIAQTAGALLNADDLAGMLSSQIFSLLPVDPVEVGAEWDVARHFTALGLEMDGKGSCSFDELKTEEGIRLAVLTEDMQYSLVTDQLEENMAEMMTVMFEKMGVELDVSIYLDADDMDTTMQTDFDIAAGFNRSMTWSEMTATVSGAVTVGDAEMDMDVETISSGHSSWSLLEEE